MAKLTALTTLTTPASGDILYIVDVSDTTDDATGSSKQITYANLIAGSSLTSLELTISGTIDDSNTTFTSSVEPKYLVINGVWYKPTGGSITWSWSGGTITLSSPIGSGVIWGFK